MAKEPYAGEIFIDTDDGMLCEIIDPNALKSDYTGDKDPAIKYVVIDGPQTGQVRLYWKASVTSMVNKYREDTARSQHQEEATSEIKTILDHLGGVADIKFSDDPDAVLPYQIHINKRGLKLLADILDS